MSYQVQFNDTTHINKSFTRSVLEGVYIGNLFNLKIKNYPVYKSIRSMCKYLFAKNELQTLTESQVRIVDNYTIIGTKLIKYYQIQIPYLANSTIENQELKYQQFSNFIENLKVYKEIDIFYYDRLELLSDYDFYFSQLDEKITTKAQFANHSGKQLANNLRNNLPDLLTEMMTKYQPRTREAFLIINSTIPSTKLEDIDKTKLILDTKVFKILTGLKELNIDYIEVVGKHREWLFNNFISNITSY
jgi:hypothetical protein